MRPSFLKGKTVYLRPLNEQDCSGTYPYWLNDPEVCAANRHCVFPNDEVLALEYIQKARKDHSSIVLAICLYENDTHVGNISLSGIDLLNRTADLSILIGEKSAWNKGVGKEAALLMLDQGFLRLNLNRISCGTFETNEGMIKLAKTLGMKEEGRLREAVYKNGKYLDVLKYAILREEYERI